VDRLLDFFRPLGFDSGMKPFRVLLFVVLVARLSICRADLKIETVAGTGKAGFSGDGGPAVKADLNNPYGLCVGPSGELFFCDMGNHRVRKIDRNGMITTVAGSGEKGWRGDGGPALAAALNEPYEVRFDWDGNMFFVEMRNNVVRRVDGKSGVISTVAGMGKAGFGGDGGAATNALLNQPHSIQFVGRELWICDIGNHRIRAVDLSSGKIKTVGGTGEKLPTREGEALAGNPLHGPRAIDVDAQGNVWLALREGNAIYRIDGATRMVKRVAGNASQGFSGNGGLALDAALSGPKGITAAKNGWIIWTDTESHSIRYLDPKKGIVELLVGDGKKGDGTDGDALRCELSRPHGVFADQEGNLWIGDSENHRIRRVKLP
jgi:streptogramin lyase